MHTENVFHTWNNTINSNLNQHVIVTQLEMALYFSMPSFAVLSPYIVTIQLFQITNNLNIAKFVIWKSCICHYVPLLHMKLPVYECVLIDWLIDWLILVIFLKLTYVCPWSYRNVYIIIIIIVVVVVIIYCNILRKHASDCCLLWQPAIVRDAQVLTALTCNTSKASHDGSR